VLGLRRPLRRAHPRRDRRAPLRGGVRAAADHPPLPTLLVPRRPPTLSDPDRALPADATGLEAARQAVPGDRQPLSAPMRLLITGGAGFVGGNLAVSLAGLHPDWQVVALDNLMRSGSELN